MNFVLSKTSHINAESVNWRNMNLHTLLYLLKHFQDIANQCGKRELENYELAHSMMSAQTLSRNP
jgi:hypothetical protein